MLPRESHLVLMQGPLVWITSTYYRRTPADPRLYPGGNGSQLRWWGGKGLGSRRVNWNLGIDCYLTWLWSVFQILSVKNKQTKQKKENHEILNGTKQWNGFRYALWFLMSLLESQQVFSIHQSNTKAWLVLFCPAPTLFWFLFFLLSKPLSFITLSSVGEI